MVTLSNPPQPIIAAATSALLEHGDHSAPPPSWRRVLSLLPTWFQSVAALVADEPIGPIDAGLGSLLVSAHAHGDADLAAAAWATLPSRTAAVPYDLRLAGGRPPLPPEAFSPRRQPPRRGNVVATTLSKPAIAVSGLSYGAAATGIVVRCDEQLHLAGRGEATRCGEETTSCQGARPIRTCARRRGAPLALDDALLW